MESNVVSGSIVKATIKNMPFIYHYGVIYNDGSMIAVLHNTPSTGVSFVPYSEWVKSRNLRKVSNSKLTGLGNEVILKKFAQVEGKNYHLLKFNCEHFIDYMLDRRRHSEQLQLFSFLGFALLLFLYTKAKISIN